MDNQYEIYAHLNGDVEVSDVDIDWSYVDLSPGARVARGMLYVQRTYPDALSKVDLGVLDIGDGEWCVLGQIHGDYGLSPEFDNTTRAWRTAHGFLLLDEDDLEEDGTGWQLNTLWRLAFSSWRAVS